MDSTISQIENGVMAENVNIYFALSLLSVIA